MNLILYPKTAMLLSINIKSKNENESKSLNGEIHLYINKSSKVILINQIKTLITELDYYFNLLLIIIQKIENQHKI